jgi:hypothetical protein
MGVCIAAAMPSMVTHLVLIDTLGTPTFLSFSRYLSIPVSLAPPSLSSFFLFLFLKEFEILTLKIRKF